MNDWQAHLSFSQGTALLIMIGLATRIVPAAWRAIRAHQRQHDLFIPAARLDPSSVTGQFYVARGQRDMKGPS